MTNIEQYYNCDYDEWGRLSEEDFQSWLDVFEAIAAKPAVRGSCEHLLYIGRKVG